MNPLDLLSTPLCELLGQPVAAQFPGWRSAASRFDGPGGTLVHAAVRDAMAGYLGSEFVANDGGGFPASRYSDELVVWSADRVRTLLGAAGGEVIFGPNMTTLTTMLLRTLADGLSPGDEIVCTELDHEANVVPWEALARSCGATIRLARLQRPGLLPAAAVVEHIGPRTRWVAVTAASNALGAVPDLSAICAAAHRVGARVFVDGAQLIAHRRANIDGWGCDALVTSAYKWYGPHAGVLWLCAETAQQAWLPEQVPSAGSACPGRIDLGTTNFEAVLGTGVAAAVLESVDRDVIFTRERALTELLLGGLAAHPEVRLLGPPPGEERVPVVTFQIDGHAADDVAGRLFDAGIAVWAGTFYAAAAMRAVAPEDPTAVRVGISWYITEDDVRALLGAVDAIIAGLGSGRG